MDMDSSDFQHRQEVRLLFESAARRSPSDRRSILARAEDDEVRDNVESLLSIFDRIDSDESIEADSDWDLVDQFIRASDPRGTEAILNRGAGEGPGWERLVRLAHGRRSGHRPASRRRRDLLKDSELVAGRYRVQERLGRGGMGEVFRAIDVDLDRDVALKYLAPEVVHDKESVTRFVNEARTASALDHPNIGYIHEIARDEEGHLFIAMAYYPGETLRARLDSGPLPIDEAVRIVRAIASGLACAHAAGIVHRDIKPSNVVLTEDGGVRIIDFGIAKATRGLDVTQVGDRLGTAAYLSPEQARGDEVDGRSDLWSLGVMLYEMIAGRRPFTAAYEAALIYEILHVEAEPLSSVVPGTPEHIDRLIGECLRKDRTTRCRSAEAFLDMLNESVAPRRLLRPRKRTTLAGGAVLTALVVGALFLALTTISRQAPERHLAVLPFEVIGNGGDDAILAAGMMETLTSRVTQFQRIDPGIWVVPARDIGDIRTPEQAREQLGATMVVTGSLQYEADRVRVTLNLIDAKTRRQIDSEQIDQGSASTMAIQDEVALALAKMLRLRLTDQPRRQLTAGGSPDPEANALYVRGWGYLRNQQSLQDVETAIAHFERAIDVDGGFVLAHAALAEAQWSKYRLTDEVGWAERAMSSSERALELGGEMSAVLISLGVIQFGRGQYEAALETFDRAIALDASDTEALRRRAAVLRRLGKPERAETDLRRSVGLKPDFWGGYNSLGVFLYQEGRYDEALRAYQRGLQAAPANSTLLINAAVAHWQQGRIEDALELLERVLSVQPNQPFARSNLATAYFYTGRFEEAAAIYREESTARPGDYTSHGFLGDALAWVDGKEEESKQAYRRALEAAREHYALRTDDADMIGSIAGYHARLGNVDSARQMLHGITDRHSPEDLGGESAFGIGEVFEQLGERDEAIRWMMPALDQGHGWIQLKHSPWLASLREDPRVSQRMRAEP